MHEAGARLSYPRGVVGASAPHEALLQRRPAGALRDQPEAGLDDDPRDDEDDGHGDARVHESGGSQGDAVGGAQDAAAEEDGPGGAVRALEPSKLALYMLDRRERPKA